MQGNCTAPPPESLLASLPTTPPLLPLLPGQCLLVSPVNVLAARGRLWLDNLYLRTTGAAGVAAGEPQAGSGSGDYTDGHAAVQIVAVADSPGRGEVWMTGCTLQGHMHGGHAQVGRGTGSAAVTGLQVAGRAFADGALLLPVDVNMCVCMIFIAVSTMTLAPPTTGTD